MTAIRVWPRRRRFPTPRADTSAGLCIRAGHYGAGMSQAWRPSATASFTRRTNEPGDHFDILAEFPPD